MKYFVRAVKCFIYYTLLFILIMVVLDLLGSIDIKNLAAYFRDGYNSLWQIAIFLAVISAVYPKFGYMKREIELKDDIGDCRMAVTTILGECGFSAKDNGGETVVFRSDNTLTKVLQLGEDGISVKFLPGKLEVEGRRRNLVRAISRLEYRLGK